MPRCLLFLFTILTSIFCFSRSSIRGIFFFISLMFSQDVSLFSLFFLIFYFSSYSPFSFFIYTFFSHSAFSSTKRGYRGMTPSWKVTLFQIFFCHWNRIPSKKSDNSGIYIIILAIGFYIITDLMQNNSLKKGSLKS